MGCRESKIKKINLTPEDTEIETISASLGSRGALQSGNLVSKKSENNLVEDDILPNRLLAAIPVSDLGDSLDSRHLGESLNLSHMSHSMNGMKRVQNNPPDSADSTDSGYDEYEEEYKHIITEHSPTEQVKQVEADFHPVDLPELLVITGRACARILSGYQKNKMEEAKILDSLRSEGLLAKPKGKTAGGMSFEVVDARVVDEHTDVVAAQIGNGAGNGNGAIGDAFISSQFIPKKKLERLESRRVNIRKPSARIDQRLAEAEERRKAAEEEKVKLVLERSGLERHGRLRSASALRRENKYTETVAKRQQQLQEMRDKLKEKHKKHDMIRLKQQLLNDSQGLSSSFKANDGFFDD